MRISIIGQPGSGKSTLANKISNKFNIPHFQIDRFYLESGGGKLKIGSSDDRERVRAYVKEKVLEFVNQDSWVSDGTYIKSQSIIAEYTDQVIFLNIPLYRRLFNLLKRVFTTKRHKEITAWGEVKFIIQTIRLTPMRNEKLKNFVQAHKDKVKILKNYKEVEMYLNSLNAN